MNRTNLNTGKQNVWLTAIQIILSFLALSVAGEPVESIVEGFIPSTTAQEIYACKVKGRAFYKNEKKWIALTERQKLKDSYWIKLESGASVTLIKQNGFKTLQGKKISQIKDIKFDRDAGTWSRLYSGLYNVVNIKPKEGVTAISRGGKMEMVFPANGEVIPGKQVNFRWKHKEFLPYSIMLGEIVSGQNSILCSRDSLMEGEISLPNWFGCTNIKAFDRSKTYAWSIARAGYKANGLNTFTFADSLTIDSLNADLRIIEKELKESETEYYFLLRAISWENYKMYAEAERAYSLAFEIFPESELIKTATKKFWLRIEALNNP
jgi:hypothetical protein